MFCANCGQNIAEGKAFCTNCGAPVKQASETAASAPAEQITATPVPAGQTMAMPAPAGPPPKPKRTGLIVGSVAAAIIVLAGVGVGVWLALRGDDGSTSTAGATTATVPGDGSSPFETIPSLDGATDGSTAGTDAGEPAGGTMAAYRLAVENVVRELDFSHGRMPELAAQISSTVPDVPQAVYDELMMMADSVAVTSAALETMGAAPGYEEAHNSLLDAASHMSQRLLATMSGIQAEWDADSGTPYFNEGRQQKAAYVAAMEEYYSYIPAGSLPGDPGLPGS